MEDEFINKSDSELGEIWSNRNKSQYSKTFIETVRQEMLSRGLPLDKEILKKEITSPKTTSNKKYSGSFLIKIVSFIILIPLFYVFQLVSNTYRMNYYPEMSNWEFLPYETIISVLALLPLFFVIVFLFLGLRHVYRSLTDKKNRLKWNEWVTVILLPVTFLGILIAYRIFKIYCFVTYPDMPVWEFFVLEYFICVYVAAILPFVGIFISLFIGQKFLGLKIEKIKSSVIFCPKCGEVMTSKFCGNCGSVLEPIKKSDSIHSGKL